MNTLTYFFCLESTCGKIYSGSVDLDCNKENLCKESFSEVKEHLRSVAEEETDVAGKKWVLTAFNRI